MAKKSSKGTDAFLAALIMVFIKLILALFKALFSLFRQKRINKSANHVVKDIQGTKTNNKEQPYSIYTSQAVQGRMLQLLESIKLIETTKNIDTLRGRYSFASERLIAFLREASSNARYEADGFIAIDRFKTLYYQQIPTETQIRALFKPTTFDLDLFYTHSILYTLERYRDEQYSQISTLKLKSAINNRKKKILETIEDIKKDIPETAFSTELRNKLSEIYAKISSEIEDIKSIQAKN